MDLNQMMIISAFILGDQDAKAQAREQHDKIKGKNPEWVISPLGSFLEEEFTNPGSRVSSILRDQARKHLSKIVRV